MSNKGITITIDRLSPGMNQMAKMHWAAKKREKEAWQVLIREAIGSRLPKFDRCSITLTRCYARNPMDSDNLTSTAKCVLDAMVRLEIIPDDSDEHITLDVRQVKVDTMKERKTIIEIAA